MKEREEILKALQVLKYTKTKEECKKVCNSSIGGYKLKIAHLKDELISAATSSIWREDKAQELIKEISFNYELIILIEEFKASLNY